MPDGQDQLCVQEEKKGGGLTEARNGVPDGKLITAVQACMRCGDTFSFTEGRKRCPHCQGQLRTKLTVTKAP